MVSLTQILGFLGTVGVVVVCLVLVNRASNRRVKERERKRRPPEGDELAG